MTRTMISARTPRAIALAAAAALLAAPFPTGARAALPVESTSWAPTGESAHDHFGYSVATAGDVNGDGLSDVIVGAPLQGVEKVEVYGRAYVYHGGVTPPLAAEPDWSASIGTETRFGWSVAPAGDVNGDGFGDVIIGAPGDPGHAYVYHGSATGLAPTPAWTRTSSAGSNYGFCVATAGDVNGDGYSDVLVGAPDWGGTFGDLGRAYLYLGSASGLATSPAWTLSGTSPCDFGYSVATAGDVNADGYDDFLVGDPGYDPGLLTQDAGRVLLFLGNASGSPTQSSWSLVGPGQNARYGDVVAPAGDLNRDGYADAMMASPLFTGTYTRQGRVIVSFGSSTGLKVSGAQTFNGSSTQRFGSSIAPAGDLDGNGYPEIVVGAIEWNGQAGRVYVYSGYPNGIDTGPDWTLDGTQGFAQLGNSVCTAGDVDGDGFADLILGERYYDDGPDGNIGRALLFRGAASGVASSPQLWQVVGDQAEERFAHALADAGDVDADGYHDLLVGAPGFDGIAGADAGRVELIYGGPSGLEEFGRPSWIREGDAAADAFGSAVGSAGDVNGDGFDDFLVAAPGADAWGAGSGRVSLYHGGASGPAGTPDWQSGVGSAGDSVGSAVASGDLNGDGFADVVIGASAFGSSGAVFCYLGSSGGLATAPTWTLTGPQAGARFGFSVATADRDGDGYSDVFVGVPGYDGTNSNEGRVLGYRGGPGGVETVATWDWTGSDFIPTSTDMQLGHAVCGIASPAGRADGVALGAPGCTYGVVQRRGVVILEYEGGWSAAFGNVQDAALGFSLADAGDGDGDGRGDVVMGATGVSYYTPMEGGWAVLSVTDMQAWWQYPAGGPEGGYAVAAGDFNGDGLSDPVGGVPESGAAGKIVGRNAGGDTFTTPFRPGLRNGENARVARLGRTDEEDRIHIRTDRAQSPAGRTRLRHEWWVFPTADDPAPEQLAISGTGSWTDTGPAVSQVGSAVTLLDEVGGLAPSTLYSIQWRLRTRNPFFPATRWFRADHAARNQGHFRTAGTVLAVGHPAPLADGVVLACPNPFRAGTRLRFSVPTPGNLEARIYDTGGRLVRTLERGRAEAGPREMFWDGRTDRGERAQPGVYFLRVSGHAHEITGRIVLMQ